MRRGGKRNFAPLLFSGLSMLMLALGCAKSLPPPGGPVDRTPPKIISSTPASGTVNLPADTRLAIEFSEAIDPKSIENGVFVSPLAERPPRIKVSENRLEIRFPALLRQNQTYIITLGTDLKDAHGVALAQSISLAMSTGQVIDSGSIAGKVYKDGKSAAGVSLALFDSLPDGVPLDSIVPEYMTQSGSDGGFAFEYLPRRQYLLLAFDDRNKNKRINFSRELTGLPFYTTQLDSSRAALKNINLELSQADSAGLNLKSVTVTLDRLLKMRLNRALTESQATALFAGATMYPEADSTTPAAVEAFTPLTPYPASDFVLMAAPLTPSLPCRLRVDQRTLFPTLPDTLRYIAGSFTIADAPDQNPPLLLDTYPANKALNIPLDSVFRFHFSEPLDTMTLRGAFRLVDTVGETTAVAVSVLDRFTFVGQTAASLENGCPYSLLIAAPRITDIAGNRLGDSATTVTFTTIDTTVLGKITGRVSIVSFPDTTVPVVLAFKPTGTGAPAVVTLPSGTDSFAVSLLPGYYTIRGFLDTNHNGVYDYGSPQPYRLAEPFIMPADTVRVRSRFESAGILLTF